MDCQTETEATVSSANIKKRNGVLYILRGMLLSGSSELCSSAFVTSFMIYMGLTTQDISRINFASNIGLLSASILTIYALNKDRSGIRVVKISSFGHLLLPLGLLFISYTKGEKAYIVLLLINFLGNVMTSAKNSAEINSAPYLFGKVFYVKLLGKSGIIAGSFAFLVCITTILFFADLEQLFSYRAFFLTASILLAVYVFITQLYRLSNPGETDKTASILRLNILASRGYLKKGIPHMMRGVGAAGVSLVPALMMQNVQMTQFQNTILIPITILCGILGSIVFLHLSNYFQPGKITMLCFLILSGCMIMAPFVKNFAILVVVYILVMVTTGMSGKSVMSTIVKLYQGDELAIMSSYHVLIYAICYCPTVLLFGQFMDAAPLPTLAIASFFYVLSGILFWRLK